ncbi:MFS transporter [Sphingomonas paeninsulae]|uniref:MFS transporter n=1 Tax=Sphingomonas paeninsulae TaxID=2319844 RepID=UPI001EF05691|nr:MFS transporter [Sphingomonas paeninsulae]
MPTSIPAGVTGERFTRAHAGLLAMLAFVVMFEGFDISLTSVVLPYLGKEYGATPATLGRALAVIALGSIAAWVLIRLADRFGRRPILLLAATGFAIGSLATVFTFGLSSYTAIQLVTRLLMVTQIAMAYLIVSETLPPSLRGRANGLLGACGSFGAALPFLALAPALGTTIGWRLLFVIGAAPLLIMPLLLWRLRETPVWRAARTAGTPSLSPSEEIRQLTAPTLRRRFIAMSLLWFIVNFATSVSSLFFTLYVVQERGWAPTDFARLAPFGLGGAFLGYLAAGALSDLIGRRWTITLFMLALGGLTQLCYTSTTWLPIAGGLSGYRRCLVCGSSHIR